MKTNVGTKNTLKVRKDKSGRPNSYNRTYLVNKTVINN